MLQAIHYVCSTDHVPAHERDAIDGLIETAKRHDIGGRLRVEHPVLSIEAYQFGFWVHTEIAFDHGTAPEGVSDALWDLLRFAFERHASWILFDRDEPADSRFPTF